MNDHFVSSYQSKVLKVSNEFGMEIKELDSQLHLEFMQKFNEKLVDVLKAYSSADDSITKQIDHRNGAIFDKKFDF